MIRTKRSVKEQTSIVFETPIYKPSTSQERGISLLSDNDLTVFSPGISTAAQAEILMAQKNSQRKIIATTIDQKGLQLAHQVISQFGYDKQVLAYHEDLREPTTHKENSFDFIYARLVLHYLSYSDLDRVLKDFKKILKPGHILYIVLRSTKNIPLDRQDVWFEPKTHFTYITYYDGNKTTAVPRYFHDEQSIRFHLKKAGFSVEQVLEYQEQLYIDFERKEIADVVDHLMEIHARA